MQFRYEAFSTAGPPKRGYMPKLPSFEAGI